MMQKRDLNYLAGILLIFAFLWMLITGLIQVRFELHRFIYHIYGAYLLIILAAVHLVTNWNKISGFIKRKIRNHLCRLPNAVRHILSIALIFSLTFTLTSGYLQVKLNLPRSGSIYHIYSAYLTLTLALIHLSLNLKKLKAYFKRKSPIILLNPDRRTGKLF